MSWVLRNSEARLGQRLALLVFADHASDDGTGSFPSIDTVAYEARLSRRAAINAINALRASGRLAQTGTRPSGTVEHAVRMEAAAEGGARFAPGANDAPEPSLSASTTNGSAKGEATAPSAAKTREGRRNDFIEGRPLRLSYRGRAVPEPLARLAVALLEEYAAQADQPTQAWTPGGAPTPELKRVLGAVVDHPDVPGPRWAEVIGGVLANPWWAGPPSVGVVFGPNVVASNLANPGRGGAGRETASQRAAREKEERIRNRIEGARA